MTTLTSNNSQSELNSEKENIPARNPWWVKLILWILVMEGLIRVFARGAAFDFVFVLVFLLGSFLISKNKWFLQTEGRILFIIILVLYAYICVGDVQTIITHIKLSFGNSLFIL